MFQILILVCSLGTAQPDCQSETALDVVRGPVVANEMLCGRDGQAYLAQTSIAPHGSDDYVKIQCLRMKAQTEGWKPRTSIGRVN